VGGQSSITSYFTTRYFGVRNFSSIYGALFPILILLGAPAPIIIGAIFDSSRSYDLALVVLEVVLTGAIVCFWCLKPYRYPVKQA
jgi:cyanate permease